MKYLITVSSILCSIALLTSGCSKELRPYVISDSKIDCYKIGELNITLQEPPTIDNKSLTFDEYNNTVVSKEYVKSIFELLNYYYHNDKKQDIMLQYYIKTIRRHNKGIADESEREQAPT